MILRSQSPPSRHGSHASLRRLRESRLEVAAPVRPREVRDSGQQGGHTRAIRAGTKAMKRRVYTEEERALRAQASKGRKPPDRWKGKHWTPEELALVGEDHDEAIAKRIGRTREAVRDRPRLLSIPAFSGWAGGGRPWSKEEDALLGTDTDEKIAKCLDRTRNAVSHQRESLGIKPYVKRWTPAADKLLGRMPDAKLAARLGRSLVAVVRRRVAMGRPPCHR